MVSVLPWFALLFAAALCVDGAVADAVHDHGIAAGLRRHTWLLAVWKSPGDFWFTAAVVIAGWAIKKFRRQEAVFLLLAGMLSGLNVIPKWLLGRTRPFKLASETVARPFELHPCRHGLYGFFHQQNLCFPSGHACTAWTLAFSVLLTAPRAAVPFMIIAGAVGVERVLENAHYCSDVLGAIPMAVVAVALAWRLMGRTELASETVSAGPAPTN